MTTKRILGIILLALFLITGSIIIIKSIGFMGYLNVISITLLLTFIVFLICYLLE